VAKEYRVSPQVVASLVHKAKRNKQFLKELLDARGLHDRQLETIKTTVAALNQSRSIISSAKEVVTQVNVHAEAPVSEKQVRSVMKEELGMSYRKIKTVSLHSNSEKNLILRQRYTIEFLAQARKKRVFLNIDETWLGMSDFRRMKWQAPGTTNSVAKLEVQPRITMILGLDTLGNVYVALAQANSNSQMMELFFRDLATRLDQERP
jgi:hypothetical protein